MADVGERGLLDEDAPPAQGGGRPRSARKDQAILDATARLLDEAGYHRTSVDAVARAAGVSKATIYLRYRDKADLAAAAVAARLPHLDNAPDSGSTQADLVTLMQESQASLEAPAGVALGGALLSEEPRSPEALHRLRSRVVTPRRNLFRTVLERGIARGEVRADANLDVVLDCLMGAYYGRRLAGLPAEPDWAENVVHQLAAALLTEEAYSPDGLVGQPRAKHSRTSAGHRTKPRAESKRTDS